MLYTPTLYVFHGPLEMAAGNWHETEHERRLGDPQVLAAMHDVEKIPPAELPDRLPELLKMKGQPPPPHAAEGWAIALKNVITRFGRPGSQ